MSEDKVDYTTQISDAAPDRQRTDFRFGSNSTPPSGPQVTGYDRDAETLATWREQLPPIVTTLAYMEAVKLYDALMHAVEGFEMSQEFKRITGAQ